MFLANKYLVAEEDRKKNRSSVKQNKMFIPHKAVCTSYFFFVNVANKFLSSSVNG
jgi:hypothetical protein